MYLLGYDLGSSSIKSALINSATGETVQVVQYPETEMNIISVQNGLAEQEPEIWWENLCIATKKLLQNCEVLPQEVKSIGIAYQMHFLLVFFFN